MSETGRISKVLNDLQEVLAKIDLLEKESQDLEKQINKTKKSYSQIALFSVLMLIFSVAIIIPVFFLINWK